MCSGLLLIQWFSLGFLLKKFFFRRNSTSQNVRLSSADLYGFSAEVHKFSNRASLQHFLSLACCWATFGPAAMEEDWSEPEFQGH